ncbi:hypothetical protein M404DRAFT_999015 [Pisolithus tinctorius Marx 270]|uniref:Uncharacterized protein n=1 Tax=Pisolithus tinctorius Marx 270 TaxID=870435 RepID=A0A0C3JBD0_PISTI|nr:hypothetical protein M404DRAFT_999015 [Pisolithus tinctorius Marx 270]
MTSRICILFRTIWIMNTPISGAALALMLFLREYSMTRKLVRGEWGSPNDAEMAATAEEAKHKAEDEGHGADLTRTNSIALVPKEEVQAT